MTAASPNTLERAAYEVVESFARLAIREGFSVGEFINSSKLAFVTAAATEIESRGKRPSISRIATLTGLSRAEVAKILAGKSEAKSAIADPRTERVMYGWYTDPDFVDESGLPRVLNMFGSGSFEELVRRFSGDIPRRALLEELISGGMAELVDEHTVRPLRRHRSSPPGTSERLQELPDTLNVVIRSASENAWGGTRKISVKFGQQLPSGVKRTIDQRSERFLEAISDYLHAQASTDNNSHQETEQDSKLRLVISYVEI